MKSIRKIVHQKMNYLKSMMCAKNNKIRIPRSMDVRVKVYRGGDNQVLLPKNLNKGKVEIKIRGSNNIIKFPEKATSGISLNLHINIEGDNNIIEFGNPDSMTLLLSIGACYGCNNTHFKVGDMVTMGDVVCRLSENNSTITIGNDCMFSTNIDIWCSDTHAVLDKEGNLQNLGKSVEIGNHVWVGKDVHIGKNTKIADNSIVGWCSNVTKVFDEENVVIAGNPAKIIKHDMSWSRKSPNTYTKS